MIPNILIQWLQSWGVQVWVYPSATTRMYRIWRDSYKNRGKIYFSILLFYEKIQFFLEIGISLPSEKYTHDDYATQDNFSQCFHWDVRNYFSSNPRTNPCYDKKNGDKKKILTCEKALSEIKRNPREIYKKRYRCYSGYVSFFRKSKECHKGSSQHSTCPDESSRKSWKCSTDTTDEWSWLHLKSWIPKRVACKQYQNKTKNHFENICIYMLYERCTNDCSYDTRDTEEKKYFFIPVFVGERKPAHISKYMVYCHQYDGIFIAEKLMCYW